MHHGFVYPHRALNRRKRCSDLSSLCVDYLPSYLTSIRPQELFMDLYTCLAHLDIPLAASNIPHACNVGPPWQAPAPGSLADLREARAIRLDGMHF